MPLRQTELLRREGESEYLSGAPLTRELSASPRRSGWPRAPFAWLPALHRSAPSGGQVVELFAGWACRHGCARRAGGLGNPAQDQKEAGVLLRAPPVFPPTLPVVTGYVTYECCTLEILAGNWCTPRGAEERERERANQLQARASEIRAGQQRCTL